MIASSRDRSSRETVKDIPVRISMTRTENARTESQFGLLRPAQSTRYSDEFDIVEGLADACGSVEH